MSFFIFVSSVCLFRIFCWIKYITTFVTCKVTNDTFCVAKVIGPDGHNKPSIQISDSVDGQTYALTIFPNDDHYAKVKPSDTVVVRANYLVMCNKYGIVMKHSELVE